MKFWLAELARECYLSFCTLLIQAGLIGGIYFLLNIAQIG